MNHKLVEEKKEKKIDLKTLIVKLLVSLLFIFILFKILDIDLNSLIEKIKSLNLFYFSLASLFATVCIFTNSYRWWIITKVFMYKLSYFRGLIWYFEGMFANNFFPSNIGGDALRAYYLANSNFKNKNMDWLNASLTVFLERLFGFIMMFFFLPLGMICLFIFDLSSVIPKNLMPLLISLSFLPFIMILTYKFWINLATPIKAFEKIKLSIDSFSEAKQEILIVIIWTLITHLSLMALNIFSALAVGISPNSIPIWYWLLIIPFGTLSAFIIPAMKGVGAKEATYIFLLGLIGLNSETSFVIAVTVFLATTISTLPGIIIFRRGLKIFKHKEL